MISAEDGISTVGLTIPMRAEYVSIARLTAAGVANRLGFDIESIEDIKVSLSEVCNLIIKTAENLSDGFGGECRIEFILSSNSLEIDFHIGNLEILNRFLPDNISSLRDVSGVTGKVVDMDRLYDMNNSGEYTDEQLQLSLIALLMDEFVVSPNKGCLVSMKKYLGC